MHQNDNIKHRHKLLPKVTEQLKELSKSASEDGTHGKYTVADLDRILSMNESSHSDNGADSDGDLPMLDMDDEDEIHYVSNYLAHQRLGSSKEEELNIDSNIHEFTIVRKKTIFVVDTNFIISHLKTLEQLRLLGEKLHHQIVIPNTVIHELDGLKKSDRMQDDGEREAIAKLARWGIEWIYKNLANMSSGVVGQKLSQRLDPDCVKDDAILDCCMFFKQKECFVILLSNDKNLCLKALTEGLLTVSFRNGMTAELIGSKAYEENVARFGIEYTNATPEPINQPENDNRSSYKFHVLVEHLYTDVALALSNSLELIYNRVFNLTTSWQSSISLEESIELLYDRWDIFATYFASSKIKQADWTQLPHCLLNTPTTLKDAYSFYEFWFSIIGRLNSDNGYLLAQRFES